MDNAVEMAWDQFDPAEHVLLGPELVKVLGGMSVPPKLARAIRQQHQQATQNPALRVPGAVGCSHYRLVGGHDVTIATAVFDGQLGTICVLDREWSAVTDYPPCDFSAHEAP